MTPIPWLIVALEAPQAMPDGPEPDRTRAADNNKSSSSSSSKKSSAKKKSKKQSSSSPPPAPAAKPEPKPEPPAARPQHNPTPEERSAAANAPRPKPHTEPHPSPPPPQKDTHRPYTGHPPPSPARGNDHRYARPAPWRVRANPHAPGPPPHFFWYRSWYSHWWVAPYWRWQTATVLVVSFPFTAHAWVDTWAPPPRAGWRWTAGRRVGARWIPGYWAPTRPVPRAGYVFVPGWWIGDVYVEGYYRVPDRPDGDWVWIDGHYNEDGSYIPGHWRPVADAPDGYVWEPGFFDGQVWVEGYWRPARRDGYHWVAATYEGDGIYDAGYWDPEGDKPGYVWVPGWFDGNQWIEGYWVTEAEYKNTDPSKYTADDGWNEGWDDKSSDVAAAEEGPPIAIPVDQ